jgi:hypothetical protein
MSLGSILHALTSAAFGDGGGRHIHDEIEAETGVADPSVPVPPVEVSAEDVAAFKAWQESQKTAEAGTS